MKSVYCKCNLLAMNKVLLFLVLPLLFVSCSEDDTDNGSSAPPVVNTDYINVTYDGVAVEYLKDSLDRQFATVRFLGDIIQLTASEAYTPSSEQSMIFYLYFDRSGNFINAAQSYNHEHYTGFNDYHSFIHFPANWFDIQIASIDEINHKIKFTFAGDIFHDRRDMGTESKHVSGEVEAAYEVGEPWDENILFYTPVMNLEQYCRASKNAEPWKAYFEYDKSAFTNSGPDRVEIHFAADAAPGSFNFTSSSTDNYVRYAKFNTTTLVYDYYETSGMVAHSYKEYMGGNQYNFIGTFSFTAINPNNPTDVVTMTAGEFRSLHQF